MNENPGPEPNPPVTPAPTGEVPPAEQPVAEPANQPSAPAPEAAPVSGEVVPEKPKKKVGLIIGIIVAVLLLVGGGTAAAIVLMGMNKAGTVADAMDKVMSGNTPSNVVVAGEITADINESSIPVKSVKLVLDSSMVSKTMVNTSKATATLTMQNGDSASIVLDEVYTEGGDIYFKVDGILKFVKDSKLIYYILGYGDEVEANCIDDASGETNCEVEDGLIDVDTVLETLGISDIVDMVDGKWLRVSVDEIKQTAGSVADNKTLTCANSLAENLEKNKDSAIQHYRDNAFVVSIDENVTLPSKKYAVHKLKFDSDILTSYIESIQDAAVLKEFYTCLGQTGSVKIDSDTVAELVGQMPESFVEIDNDNNFSRVYFETQDPEGYVTIKTDLSFNYPGSINVAEPSEYKNLTEVIQTVMNSVLQTNQKSYVVEDTKL